MFIFERSGMRLPTTINAMSCLVVFPVIHPTRVWVNQSAILFPPFEPKGVCVEPVGSDKEVQYERDGEKAAQIDQRVFPLWKDQK